MSTVSEQVANEDTQPRGPRGQRRAERPRRRWVRWLLVGGLVVVLVGVFAALVAAQTLSMVRHAKSAQSSLEAFKTALSAGDDKAASRDLGSANVELAAARKAYGSVPLKVAGAVPFLGWPVNDAGHLLRAAEHVSSAGASTLRLYGQVRGGNSKLFKNDTVSLSELHSVTGDANGLVAQLDLAAAELHKVHGASWEPQVASARDKALRQVDSLRGDGQTAQRFLSLAPGLVGENGVRTYLVAVLNPAELQDAGGSALNMLTVRFDHGHMKIVQSGSTFDITNENSATKWKTLPEDPWLKGAKHVLAAADRSPDWRTSGQELMLGYTAQFGTKLDGIIGIDPVALQGLISQVGAFTTPGYGEINGGNLVQKLLVDSYTQYTDYKVRHDYNNQLMTTLLHQVLGGGHMLGKGKALRDAAAHGHLQVYMDDPKVQQEVVASGLLRTLPDPSVGDVIGVYTTNTTASKVDIWQKRSITQSVHLTPDGSADVTRTVVVDNASPKYTGPGPDIGTGYLTRESRPAVALYMGAGAKLGKVTVDGTSIGYVKRKERGLPVILLKPVRLQQGQSMKVVLHYTLPARFVHDGLYRFALTAQPMINDQPVSVSVSGAGSCSATGKGWTSGRGSAQYQLPAAAPLSTSVACRA